MLNKDDLRTIEGLIAAKLDLMSAFRGLPESDRESIAHDIEAYLYGRSPALRKPENFYTPRWTKGMADINFDNTSPTPLAQGHAGPTLPRWIDIVGGTAYLDSDDPQILHIAAGGGADCMFDYLVSTCWATEVAAGRGVEGQTMTSLSGCTFIVYSTITLAMTAIDALGVSDSSTVFICRGIYDETFTVPSNTESGVIMIGSGIDNTIIRPSSGLGSVITVQAQSSDNNVMVFRDFTVDTSDMTTGSIGIEFAAANHFKLLHVRMNAGVGDIGFRPHNIGLATNEIVSCTFSGGGTGIQPVLNVGRSMFLKVDACDFMSGLSVGVELGSGTPMAVTISNSAFWGVTTGVTVTGTLPNMLTVTGCMFENATDGIKITNSAGGGESDNCIFTNNQFNDCTDGIDLDTASGTLRGIIVANNTFRTGGASDIGIRLDSTRVTYSLIMGNSFLEYTSGNEISGITSAQALTANTQIVHNTTDSGATLPEYGIGHAVGGGPGAPSPHNLVSVHHDGEQDYTNVLHLLGIKIATDDLEIYSDLGTTLKALIDAATGTIRFYDSDSSNYVGIKAPATAQTENWVIHLPDDDPTVGQVLAAKAVASPDVTTEWITQSAAAASSFLRPMMVMGG